MKRTFALAAMLWLAGVVCAQGQQLKLSDCMSRGMYPSAPLRNLQFAGRDIAYVRNDTLFTGSLGTQRPVLTLAQLNGELTRADIETVAYMPSVEFENPREIRFTIHGRLLSYNTAKRTLSQLAEVGEHEGLDMAPQTFLCAYTDGNALCVQTASGTARIGDGEQGVVYGQAVHRHEFGIEKGTFWSPKGNRLAFYRMDESMVTDYPKVNTSSRIAAAEPFKYPMAGMKSHEVTVGVYNAVTEQTVYLQTRRDTSVAEREAYLTNISWSPDERHIYIAKVNRKQDSMAMQCYDAVSGALLRTLFVERDSRYVEPCAGLRFLPDNADEFLWLSRRDGYNHIYRYRTDGTLVGQLTSGAYEVDEIIGFDQKGKYVFFYANKDEAVGRAAYRLELANGQLTLMTPDRGTHSVKVSADGKQIIDCYSNIDTPYRIIVATAEGREKKELYAAPNPLKDYDMPAIKIDSLAADDGITTLYYRLITPPHMEAGKRYPTLVYVYGGPHSQLVTDEWLGGAGLYMLYLAQQGYVVFTLDNRGTSRRGMDFEACVHRRLGELQLADQMEGVRMLKSLPFVDSSRMGVEGWSFGGFMTITMKLAYPEVFKVGCAGGPVIDWRWYEIMYGERYMDTPQENPDGYASSSLLGKADQLQGRLLVIHGAEDDVVMWQNSLEFINACIASGRQIDYFVYPHHRHNVIGIERLHLYKKMFDYYETFLK